MEVYARACRYIPIASGHAITGQHTLFLAVNMLRNACPYPLAIHLGQRSSHENAGSDGALEIVSVKRRLQHHLLLQVCCVFQTHKLTTNSFNSPLYLSPTRADILSSPASKVASDVVSFVNQGASPTSNSPPKSITFNSSEDQSGGIGAYFRPSPTGLKTNHFERRT